MDFLDVVVFLGPIFSTQTATIAPVKGKRDGAESYLQLKLQMIFY
jgi:hypothetical protein